VHPTSGAWHQTTVVNIARNPLLRAVVAHGRRSMGDQLRFSAEGPRPMEESDYRADGRPKVVTNPEAARVEAAARFGPLVEPERHQRLLTTLDQRGGTQRGKPRSRDPKRNPLGGRVFDMACGWPMYRQPSSGSFRYLCGLYQQSHGASCRHNHVDGPTTVRFLLESIHQRVLAPGLRARLEAELRRLAEADRAAAAGDVAPARAEARLKEVERELSLAEANLARAEGEAQFKAVAAAFERLRAEKEALEAELRSAAGRPWSGRDPQEEVAAALARLDGLGELAADPANLPSIGELFVRLKVRLFLRFGEAPWGKRTVTRVCGGVVIFGSTPPPVALYVGPTARRHVKSLAAPVDEESTGVATASDPGLSAREGDSSGNVSRGERI
jgi:hypothetical protein